MAKDSVSVPFGVPVELPVGLILCDMKWNLRSEPKAAGEEDEIDFDDLVKSIAGEGLRDPIIVRPVTGKSGKQYQVVDGHRRFLAHVENYHKKLGIPGVKKDHIRVIVQNLDEEGARDWNISSVVQRSNVAPCDLAWAIKERVMLNPRKWDGVNQSLLCQKYGFKQAYFGKLVNIGKGCTDAVFEAWRATHAASRLSVAAMTKIAALPAAEQETKFTEETRGKDTTREGQTREGEGGPMKWLANSRKAASQLGVNLGAAQKAGLLTVKASAMFTVKGLQTMGINIKTSGKTAATEKQANEIVDACEESFARALDAKAEPTAPAAPASDTNVKKGAKKAATAN